MGFKTMGTLRNHALRHSTFKPIACLKCPRRFYDNADLRKHMDVHSDAKYICDLCGSLLNSKRSLDEHKSKEHVVYYLILTKKKLKFYFSIGHRHRKAEEQTCGLCSMKFRTLYNLKRHLLTHTGEKRKLHYTKTYIVIMSIK